MPIPAKITELTGITDAMVKDAPSQSEAVSAFLEFAGDNVLVAHNAPFDTSFIRKACENMNREYNYTSIDTVAISRAILTDIKTASWIPLQSICDLATLIITVQPTMRKCLQEFL